MVRFLALVDKTLKGGKKRELNWRRPLLACEAILFLLGWFLMYNSGFLLHPNGYVMCSGLCYYYEVLYPILKAEFWLGFLCVVASLPALLVSVLWIRWHPKQNNMRTNGGTAHIE